MEKMCFTSKICCSYDILKIVDLSVKKVKVFIALLYGAETWKVDKETTKKFQTLINKAIRKILQTKEAISNCGTKRSKNQ
jgi:hypothetical protein